MNYQEVVQQNHEHFDRVRHLTPEHVNRKLDDKAEITIEQVKAMGPDAIRRRLNELDREWDIDRVLMLNFSVLVFTQLVLAVTKNRKWLWGPLLQTPFLFMHSTLGWCPPSLWFRPMGFRTRKEIQSEREVLLADLKARTVSGHR